MLILLYNKLGLSMEFFGKSLLSGVAFLKDNFIALISRGSFRNEPIGVQPEWSFKQECICYLKWSINSACKLKINI